MSFIFPLLVFIERILYEFVFIFKFIISAMFIAALSVEDKIAGAEVEEFIPMRPILSFFMSIDDMLY